MKTVNIIKLLNSKLFHDLGNAMTTLGLIDDNESSMIQDIIFQFKTLRQVFVEVDAEMNLSLCNRTLTQYFENRKVSINFIGNDSIEFSTEQYQLIINLIMCLATSIAYAGNITTNIINNNNIAIEAHGNSIVSNSPIENILNKKDDIELETNNIQAYFAYLLAKEIGASLSCSCQGKTSIVKVTLR